MKRLDNRSGRIEEGQFAGGTGESEMAPALIKGEGATAVRFDRQIRPLSDGSGTGIMALATLVKTVTPRYHLQEAGP